MPSVTAGLVRELNARSYTDTTVSCYLDVDAKRFPRQADVERELERVARPVLTRLNGNPANAGAKADLARIAAHVRRGFDRSASSTLAIFCCGADDLFEVIELPVSIPSQVLVGDAPALAPLEAAIGSQDRLAVLLMDRSSARLALVDCDELIDWTVVLSDDAAEEGDPSPPTKGGVATVTRTTTRTAAATRVASSQLTAHARRISRAVWDLHQNDGFDRIVLGGADDVVHEVQRQLHPYVIERATAVRGLTLTSPAAKIREAAREAAVEAKRHQEAQLITKLRENAAAGQRAVAGLVPTLNSLAEHRVERLVVSHGFTAEGWSCPSCHRLARLGRACPTCGGDMTPEPDVVGRLVERARAGGARVEFLVGNADLDVLGQVGGFLRF